MEKVIRDGMVAVLYSPGFGTGWYTKNTGHKELLFHPKLIEMVENSRRSEITDSWIKENLGISGINTDGAEDLEIMWLPEGTVFTISECDGGRIYKYINHNGITPVELRQITG